ncbi:MAG TPA: hypothetical protein VHB97_19390 [Polyangia bacterium]|nr:hypothetical protein [Polyangia bacterium]
MRLRLLVVALLPLLVAAGGRPYHNDAMKVRGFEAPLGWEPQPVGSYARLLAAWETKDGGRMTLVAQKVKEGATARSLADESRPALERQRLRDLKLSSVPPAGDDSDRALVDAIVDDGHRFVRQLYAVAGDIGYVVTMVGPIARAPQMKRDFDEAATSLTVGDSGEAANPKR